MKRSSVAIRLGIFGGDYSWRAQPHSRSLSFPSLAIGRSGNPQMKNLRGLRASAVGAIQFSVCRLMLNESPESWELSTR